MAWTAAGNLKGPPGDPGSAGASDGIIPVNVQAAVNYTISASGRNDAGVEVWRDNATDNTTTITAAALPSNSFGLIRQTGAGLLTAVGQDARVGVSQFLLILASNYASAPTLPASFTSMASGTTFSASDHFDLAYRDNGFATPDPFTATLQSASGQAFMAALYGVNAAAPFSPASVANRQTITAGGTLTLPSLAVPDTAKAATVLVFLDVGTNGGYGANTAVAPGWTQRDMPALPPGWLLFQQLLPVGTPTTGDCVATITKAGGQGGGVFVSGAMVVLHGNSTSGYPQLMDYQVYASTTTTALAVPNPLVTKIIAAGPTLKAARQGACLYWRYKSTTEVYVGGAVAAS